MKSSIGLGYVFISVILLISPDASGSGKRQNPPKSVKEVTGTPAATYFDINNVSTVFRNDGISDIDIQQQNSGFVFPKGSRKTCVFQSGFLWGGSIGGEVRVGGSTYRTGLQPGKILSSGVPEDPNIGKNRIYRVRPDINPYLTPEQIQMINVTSEMNDEGQGKDAIIAQYQSDWSEWPATDGAPFVDKDHNGVYDPAVDVPGVEGADQTIWYVANDLSSALTTSLYGSTPMGIEFQVTVWGYNKTGALGNMLFRRYLMINKGAQPAGADTINNMYVSQWSDPDDGNSLDDYAGCDTTLSLGYVYNANAVDAVYTPLPPPAVGFDFFQGPVVNSPGDSAIFRGQRLYGKTNLPMTAFYYFTRGNATLTDPTMGDYSGTTEFYNFFQGKIGKTGQFFTDPDSQQTKFTLSGDPVAGTGWLDGQILPAGDRRIGLASGPFTMAPGDTQEVVVGELAAGATPGIDRLTSISELKRSSTKAHNFYLRGTPVVSLDAVKPIYPTGSIVNLHGSYAVLSGSITGSQWLIVESPGTSSAQIVVVSPTDGTLQPDVPGLYRIAFVGIADNGKTDTAYVQFEASNNTPPVVSIQVSPFVISIGDTVHLDGTATHDADGDSLTYDWSIVGEGIADYLTPYDTLRGTMLNGRTAQAGFIPVRASTILATLTVQDSLYTSTDTETIVIQPITTSNILEVDNYFSMNGIYTLPRGQAGYYSHGPFRKFPDGSIWTQAGGAIFQLNFNDIGHPLQCYTDSGFSPMGFYNNFIGISNLLCAINLYGRGVNVMTTDGSRHILGIVHLSPFPWIFYGSDSIAFDVYYKSPYLYVSYGTAGIYEYDVSNPSYPTLTHSMSTPFKWTGMLGDGSHLYGVDPVTSELSMMDVTDPHSFTAGTVLLNHPYRGIRKLGQYFYCFSQDTIGIYDLSDVAHPVLIAEIPVPNTLNNGNIITDLSGDANTMMVGTAEGVYFYNVSNPGMPAMLGKFITGYPAGQTYLGEQGAVSWSWGRGLLGGYEGLNVFHINMTGVHNIAGKQIPEKYQLFQNYPNPFNPVTTLEYTLPADSKVRLTVYNILGEVVATLVNGVQRAGYKSVEWNAGRCASGVYFYRMEAASVTDPDRMFTDVRKSLLIK